jgi:hypothetical protein
MADHAQKNVPVSRALNAAIALHAWLIRANGRSPLKRQEKEHNNG